MSIKDKRDLLAALDALRLALADHGHVWTGAERLRFEKAIRIVCKIVGD